MTNSKMIEEWWTEAEVGGDASLEDDHGMYFWNDVIDNVIQENLSGKTVLDFGCNQGGFLRYLHEKNPYAKGVGVDIAAKSIMVAQSRKGNLPLEYFALTSLDQFNEQFDVATSTAVIYLISDIKTHAKEMFKALKPGGIYYATHPDYTQSEGGRLQIEKINEFAAVKASEKTLQDIAAAFAEAGFMVSIKKMTPKGYLNLSVNSTWYRSVYDQIHHNYEERYAFRLVKPAK